MSLRETENECAANAVAPRVSLADIVNAIAARHDFIASDVLAGDYPVHKALELLSICILVMRNGFTVIGKTAPASPENFNRELGKKLAYEDAIRQLWPLMGFALRDRLSKIPAPSHRDVTLADQNEHLAHITKMIELRLEVGSDGNGAICEQTGAAFETVCAFGDSEEDACRAWLRKALEIRVTFQPEAKVIYWRLRPELGLREDGLYEVRGRLCFG